jgi:cytochrome c-type biogenesis protein
MSDFVAQIPIAFASGLISVLSPCVMPLMPAYLSLISGISVRDLAEGGAAGGGSPASASGGDRAGGR